MVPVRTHLDLALLSCISCLHRALNSMRLFNPTKLGHSPLPSNHVEPMHGQTPPRISPELESVLEEMSATGVPYYGWGVLKELLAARMAEVVGALEKKAGFRQVSGGKAYAERR